MTDSKRPRRRRSYITGEKGNNRVRLFAHRSGTMMLEYRDEVGAKKRVSLRHDDFERGKAAADKLAADLRNSECPQSTELTLKALFENYEREVTPTKSLSKQAHDKRTLKLFEKCWGSSVSVKNLDRRDWDRFIQQRRSGGLRHDGGDRKKKGVRERVIEYDLRLLLAVCNWAEMVRVGGQPMLERNPFRGFPLPVEANTRRPMLTNEEFSRLTDAAHELAALAKAPTKKGRENGKKPWKDVELYLLLAHETGHRCTAIGRLRWSDVDIEKGLITWRAGFDKIGTEHRVPISESARIALKAAGEEFRTTQREAGRIGDGWVFPSPTDPNKPVRRDVLRDAWQKLEKRAKLERIPGRGWHSLRRKFATDRQDQPLKALCSAGGWKDHNTVMKCYIQPDEATLRAVVERRAVRSAGT